MGVVNKTDPKLRFPEFDEAWVVSSIDEIASFRRGSFPQPYGLKKWYDDENGLPFIQVFDVSDDLKLKKKTKRQISELAREQSVFVPKGSIVLTIQGSIGRIAVTQYDACCDRTLLIFTGFKVPLAEMYFVYALFLRFEIEKKIAVGGTIKTITKEKLKVFPIPLPTLPEQQKIANFLTAVDGRIGQLTQKKALLEDYKKGVMQQLFSQAIRFKDDHGNDFPDWEEKKLGEVGDFKNGLNKDKSDFGFGSPFVNLMDVFGKSLLNRDEFGLVNANKKELSSYDLKAGDVLFIRSSVKRTGVGEAIVVADDLSETVYSGFLIRFRSKGGELTSDFMMYCFAASAFRKELLSYATTSANTNINQESLAKIRVGIPSINEQTKIADFLSAIDRKIESVATQITQTQTFKRGLLQQMFV